MENNQQINGYDLLSIGYLENEIIGIALKINKKRNSYSRIEMLEHYASILKEPEKYIDNKIFNVLAVALIENANKPVFEQITLKENPLEFTTFGFENIEEGAFLQMNTAMKLPITVGGALMPDAHQGYGLPIGGVLATRNAVIPYGVGVDIGCRMALSILDIPEHFLIEKGDLFKDTLLKNTNFGAGNGFQGQYRTDHQVLSHETFTTNKLLKDLHDKAYTQLGSSGGGNHFVEFGIIEFAQPDNELNIDKGKYVAVLSHSGSRGFGAAIAGYYTKLAKEICQLPYEARNLAYFNLDSAEGQEYWLAMNLAGDYASACHEIIHDKIVKSLGAEVLAKVENHHNFAWKEIWNNEEVIVHRKGANPAGKGILSLIPGSMTAPGFLVRGKGNESAINSSSHGAGRQLNRTKANQLISKEQLNKVLAECGVTLIGAGTDEAPMAYKDIFKVMQSQKNLVETIATFTPKIVRMANDGSKED